MLTAALEKIITSMIILILDCHQIMEVIGVAQVAAEHSAMEADLRSGILQWI